MVGIDQRLWLGNWLPPEKNECGSGCIESKVLCDISSHPYCICAVVVIYEDFGDKFTLWWKLSYLVNIWILLGSYEFITFVECFIIFYHKSVTILVWRSDDLKKVKNIG